MANIEIIDEKYFKKYKKPITYYMDDRLKKQIDEKVKPDLAKKDKDIVILLDGHEGSGKTTLGLQIGKYIDPTLTTSRVVFNAEDFRDAILRAKKGQVVIYDEAFTGLSARSSLSGVNKILVSLMMQMRQKNLCVIIILPTFFLLDKYVALFRSKALLHIYETGGNRGYFRVYNQKRKKLLYLFGSKTYNYAPKIGKKKLFTRFKGRFYGVFALGDADAEKEYRNKKAKALQESEKNPMTSSTIKYRDQRDICIHLLKKELKLSSRKLAEYLLDYGFDISNRQILSICSKFGDISAKEEEKEEIEKEKGKKDKKSDENVELIDENNQKDDIIDELTDLEPETDENEEN